MLCIFAEIRGSRLLSRKCPHNINTFKMKKISIQQILSFITCVLLIAAVSIRRDGKVLGHDFSAAETTETAATGDTLRTMADGTVVVSTQYLAKDVMGYGGTVPLEISLKDGVVTGVKALENSETPDFFEEAATLLDRWNGLSIGDAQALQVDVVSGATFSSKAIIANMQRGLDYAAQNASRSSIWHDLDLSPKAVAGLIVALMAAILPLFVKNRRYRIIQQVLNIVVLGFWCGTFVNYSMLINFMSNGINVVALLAPFVLLITAFVYPLFGKKTYYCTNVCPFGSLQELAGRCVGFKIKMKPHTMKRLDLLRQVLWAVLMLCLWTGLWFDWIDYEPFSAFIFQSASWIVIALALVFVGLSTVVMRPYCRFVCPTGTLLKYAQSISILNKKRPKADASD